MVTFTLKLNGNLCFNFIGTEDTSEFLEDFARIVSLKPGSTAGGHNLIFVRHRESLRQFDTFGFSSDRHALSSAGWRIRNFKPLIIWSNPQTHDIIYEIGEVESHSSEIYKMLNLLMPIYDASLKYGGFPLHAALVSKQDMNFLLAGRSGTGKSTSCQRLPIEWKIYADDHTLVIPQSKNDYFAHPLPTWSEYLKDEDRDYPTWDMSQAVRINGIFFIRHGKEDEMTSLNAAQSVVKMNQSTREKYRFKYTDYTEEEVISIRKSLFENVIKASGAISCYDFSISVEGEFWRGFDAITL